MLKFTSCCGNLNKCHTGILSRPFIRMVKNKGTNSITHWQISNFNTTVKIASCSNCFRKTFVSILVWTNALFTAQHLTLGMYPTEPCTCSFYQCSCHATLGMYLQQEYYLLFAWDSGLTRHYGLLKIFLFSFVFAKSGQMNSVGHLH